MAEKKHLKIEVSTVFGQKVLRIAEQTHRGPEFGLMGAQVFSASNGFYLTSHDGPQAVCGELCTRGEDIRRDLAIITVPSEEWLAKLRVAVCEYNTTFSGEGIEVIE